MIRNFKMKQVYKACQAEKGAISSLPGVFRDVDRQEWLIKTAFGLQPIEAGMWLVWLVNNKLILMKDEEFWETFEEC